MLGNTITTLRGVGLHGIQHREADTFGTVAYGKKRRSEVNDVAVDK